METRKLTDLRPHPENARIYGDGADAELVASVRAKGVLVPLVVTRDNRVIAGHRRLDAARQAGLDAVPVTVFLSADELDITEALVHANRQRVKTNEQMGREAKLLLRVEKERAALRKKESAAVAGKTSAAVRSGKGNVVEPVPPRSDGGKARDKVGAALGVSGKTAERAAAVVEKIDALEQEGKETEAEELRQTLNKNGAGAAHKKVVPAKTPEAESFDEERAAVARSALHFLTRLRNALRDLSLLDDRFASALEKVRTRLGDIVHAPKAAAETASEPDPDTDPAARWSRGKGIWYAHEAIDSLRQIPQNDGLRKAAFQLVKDWIKQNS